MFKSGGIHHHPARLKREGVFITHLFPTAAWESRAPHARKKHYSISDFSSAAEA